MNFSVIWISWTALFRILQRWIFLLNLIIWNLLPMKQAKYMTTAVESYHDAYDNGGYNQLTADYAKENYARAYKRIQIIITFLHGEQPEDVNLTTAEETAAASAAE